MADENNSNPAEAYQNLLKKHNDDANAVALKLFGENYDYRNRIRDLEKNQVKDGMHVLTADEFKKYEAAKDFDFEAAKKAIEQLPELEKQNKELAQMENLREVASLGIDGARLKLSVLKDQLQKFPDALISFKTETDPTTKKERKVALVKTGDKESSFAEFAKANLSDYLPALKESAEAPPSKTGNSGDPAPHTATRDDLLKREVAVQGASGRYSL